MDVYETLAEANPDAVIWPDFDDAYLGIGQQFNKQVAVYSYTRMIDSLVARGATREEATEHIDFNTLGQYTGPYDPIVLFDGVE